jgi:DNA (cytosine-5)-methyltransferase 1
MNNISVFSFFSGIGFLDLGFEKSKFKVVYCNEITKPFVDAYKYSRTKMQIPLPKYGFDVFGIDELFSSSNSKRMSSFIKAESTNNLTCFIGGPPCPDFSVGGKNKGEHGDNGRLSLSYVELITKHLPDIFLFENVKGLWRTKKHRHFYDELKEKLEFSGYSLTEKLINSIQYGAPQDRDRIILIGFKKSSFKLLSKDPLSNFFDWSVGVKYKDRGAFNKFVELSDLVKHQSHYELTVQHWFEKNQVNSHVNQKHCFIPRAALSKFLIIQEGDDSRKSYKRLHRYRYSPTAAYGNNEVHIHPTEPRRISAAEALAIQSLPKSFQLPNEMTLTNMFKAIGNGVPFVAAKGIASAIQKTVDKLNSAKK